MQYTVKIEDFSLNLDIEIQSDDFELVSEIQIALENAVESYREFQEELEKDENEEDDSVEEDEEGSSIVLLEDDQDYTITITRNKEEE
jgi:hypothetical protein